MSPVLQNSIPTKLTNATRKIDAYMPMMIIQNLGDLGWKFFSASPYSSSSSKGRGAFGARCADCKESAEDMINHTAGTMKKLLPKICLAMERWTSGELCFYSHRSRSGTDFFFQNTRSLDIPNKPVNRMTGM